MNNKQYTNIRMNIAALQARYGLTDTELRIASRLSDSAFRARKKDPGRWRVEELSLIAAKLHTTVARLVGSPNELLKGESA